MKKRHIVIGKLLVLGLLLALAAGVALAQEPNRPQPRGDLSITQVVDSVISYQGMLIENDSPVDGNRNMVFRLYSDNGCATQVGSDIDVGSVSVNEGYFDVDLPVDPADFDGQGLWLEVEVGGTAIACEEIQPVPYALSLRPGAQISDTTTSTYVGLNQRRGDFLTVDYGVIAETWDDLNHAVYGSAHGSLSRGVVGFSDHAAGYGGYFANTEAGGVAIMAAGSGIIKSTAPMTIAVNPLDMVQYYDSNVTFRPNLGYMEIRPSATGWQDVFVPVDLPAGLFGTEQKLERVRVCYKLDNANSFIDLTGVNYMTDTGNWTVLVDDDTDRISSGGWECYTVVDASPAAIGGSLTVAFRLDFDGTGASHDIQIGKIILTLIED